LFFPEGHPRKSSPGRAAPEENRGETRGETRDRCGGLAIPAPGEEIATLAGERSLAMIILSRCNYSWVCPFDHNPFRLWSADERISMVRKAPCGYSASGVFASEFGAKTPRKVLSPPSRFWEGGRGDGFLPKSTQPVSSYESICITLSRFLACSRPPSCDPQGT